MATNFPTSVDVLTNPVSNDSLNNPSHSTQHANANDALEAIEGYILNGTGADWKTWAPTLSGGWANGDGNWTARYIQIGKTVFVSGLFTIGATTTRGTNLVVSLPVNMFSQSLSSGFNARCSISGANYPLFMSASSVSAITLQAANSAGTYLGLNTVAAAVPAAWNTGDTIVFGMTYQAA